MRPSVIESDLNALAVPRNPKLRKRTAKPESASVVRADEKLTAFVELQSVIRTVNSIVAD